jgi:hypothetical protein
VIGRHEKIYMSELTCCQAAPNKALQQTG